MTTPIDANRIAEIENFDTQQRFNYLLKEVVKSKQIWVLVDEHGCMMLNTEDEDCIPIWPNAEFAQTWATDDWQDCKPEAISLNKWHSRWTSGLEDDGLALVVFPNLKSEGLIIYADEFDFELKQATKKNKA